MENLRKGDNLVSLRAIDALSIDLVYLDPPYNSGRDYSVTIEKHMAQEEAYEDTWTWGDASRQTFNDLKNYMTSGPKQNVVVFLQSLYDTLGRSSMLAYLVMMAPRLLEIQRVLKKTGSMYLHCDTTASHYLKILCDMIFGPKWFQNEIIWKRTSSHNDSSSRYGKVHDVILFYRGEGATWNDQYTRYTEEYVESHYRYEDPGGRRFRLSPLTAESLSGENYKYEWRGHNRVWRCPKESMAKWDAQGLLYYSKNGLANKKKFLDEGKGVLLQDLWLDIMAIGSRSKESVDFDGQKPVALLERIIRASSNKGDLVLDPFLGSGTTAVAAKRLGRNWIGLELTNKSAKIAKDRLDQEFGIASYSVSNDNPVDIDSAKLLAKENHYKFQCWVVSRLNGIPNGPGGDGGVDGNHLIVGIVGKPSQNAISQVKAGGVDLEEVKAFRQTVTDHKALFGIFVAFQDAITSGMREEASRAGVFDYECEGHTKSYPRIQIVTIEKLFDRNLENGNLKFPGFMRKPDTTTADVLLGTRSGFNEMEALASEFPEY